MTPLDTAALALMFVGIPAFFWLAVTLSAPRRTKWKARRAYTIRSVSATGDISTVGKFQGHATLREAQKAVAKLLTGDV